MSDFVFAWGALLAPFVKQAKLQRGEYPCIEACATEVRVVWTNAYLYNPVSRREARGLVILMFDSRQDDGVAGLIFVFVRTP